VTCNGLNSIAMKLVSKLAIVFFLLGGAGACFSATPIEGRTVARWEPQPHWSPGREALEHDLKETDGWLDFSLEGDDSIMTWTCGLTPDELQNEPRYLVLRYRAFNLQIPLFNSNHRTIRGKLLVVPHKPGAIYEDAWNRAPVPFTMVGDNAALTLQIGPRNVGCIVQGSSRSPRDFAP